MKKISTYLNKRRFQSFYGIAIVLLMLMQISLPGLVLCFGTDGHVLLETSTNGFCCESISNSDYVSYPFLKTENNFRSNHCGTCVDVQISDSNSEDKIISSNDLMPEIDIHAFSAYALSSERPEEYSGQSLIVQELPTGNTFLDSIQTTIIIC